MTPELEYRITANSLEILRSLVASHAIFNTLTVIQNEILLHNRQQALGALSKFSKFLRSAASGSSDTKNAMSKELQFMRCYTDLEELRFKDSLSFTHGSMPEAEGGDVPSLLLVPFCEIALLRWVKSNVEQEVHLKISAETKEDMLHVVIRSEQKAKAWEELYLSAEQQHRVDLFHQRLNLLQEIYPGLSYKGDAQGPELVLPIN